MERKLHKFHALQTFRSAHEKRQEQQKKKLSSSFSKSFQQLAIEVNYNSVPGSTRRLRTNGHSPYATKKYFKLLSKGRTQCGRHVNYLKTFWLIKGSAPHHL